MKEGDKELWHQIIQDIKPLKNKKNASLLTEKKPLKPKEKIDHSISESKKPSQKNSTIPSFEYPLKKKIIKGKQPINARLDLHGLTQDQAFDALKAFVKKGHEQGHKILLVITGKGIEQTGILKRLLPFWLQQTDIKPYLISWEIAHPVHGGEGAFYIHMRRKKSKNL